MAGATSGWLSAGAATDGVAVGMSNEGADGTESAGARWMAGAASGWLAAWAPMDGGAAGMSTEGADGTESAGAR